jgi:hypothetical protein
MLFPLLVGLTLATGCGLPSELAGDEVAADTTPVSEDATGDDSVDQVEQEGTFNPCVCLDMSQVVTCPATGTVCYEYYRSGTTTNWCAELKRNVTCPRYLSSKCRISGYAPNGLPCCSGRSRYNGNGTLVCSAT